ncbi:MAG: methyltransferase [Gammaproteobacteria bacterium]|nr:methyltransferase [Gammaproteobacteria bacterium]
MYTYPYAQPDAYRFSLDSIHFAEFLAAHLQARPDLQSLRTLDLCAGCGVIGIELSWYLRDLKKIDFVEVQEIYTSYFYQNVATVNRPELQLRWHQLNYDALLQIEWANQFHLIVSNPPYFQPNQGMLSPSEFKNRCRFYLDSTFANFILAMVNALAEGGEAYFLLRSLKQHGDDVFSTIQGLLQDTNATAKIITQIRGTDVVLLEKSSLELGSVVN